MPRTLGLGVNFGTKPEFQFARIFNRLSFTPSDRPFGPSKKNTMVRSVSFKKLLGTARNSGKAFKKLKTGTNLGEYYRLVMVGL